MKRVFLDESGNTGAALLDPRQPTFVLSSNDFTDDESAALIECARSEQKSEIKFSALRKSSKGRRKILEFMKQELITNERTKTTVFHKRFMVVTKVVDILIENVAYATGIDLYKDGLNIALSNLHYHCMPTFCGADECERTLRAFVDMLRLRTDESIQAFYKAVSQLYEKCSDRKYRALLAPIAASREMIAEILEDNDYFSLDPAIPSLFNHCSSWGDQLGREFTVVHDTSKPIKAQLDTFNMVMGKDIPYQEVGYDRRRFTFPLRTQEIGLEDSRKHHQIQIADLLASGTAYLANSIATGKHDALSKSLRDCGVEELVINVIWPSTEVTPEALGTAWSGGSNPIDAIVDRIQK